MSKTDELGYSTAYTYDQNGNKLSVTNAKGINLTVSKDAYGREILTTIYDNRNNPFTRTGALDHTTTNVYDSLNRLRPPLQRLTEYASMSR